MSIYLKQKDKQEPILLAGSTTNNSGSVTEQDVDNAISEHNTLPDAHSDIRESIIGGDEAALQSAKDYANNIVAEVETNALTFKGYISINEPTNDLREGNLWYQPASAEGTPDTNFPWQVKTYTNGAWSVDTINYTPSAMDLWSNLDAIDNTDADIQVKTNHYAKGLITDTPLQIIFDKLIFAIVKNTADNMASICMKSAVSGSTVNTLFSMSAWYGGSTQSSTAMNTVQDEWVVIDNDAGYNAGGAHRIIILDTDTQDMYDITTSVTGNGINNTAVMGAIYGKLLTA